MSADTTSGGAHLGAALGPYARETLARGVALARRLHSEQVSPEHWLTAMLEDESCAATRAVLHAFADPETIAGEVLAQCEGIMVVGSGRTLPFSVLSVQVLYSLRASVDARGEEPTEAADLFHASRARFRPELAARLAALPGAQLQEHGGSEPPPAAPPEGRLFGGYSSTTLRALGAACRAAASLRRSSIGPFHLALGCLEVSPELCRNTGLSSARVRMAAAGLDEDTSALPARTLEASEYLRELLAALPAGAETLDALAWMLAHGNQEVASLLRRQKITAELLGRCRGTFTDPAATGSQP